MPAHRRILRLRVQLLEVHPPVWRRIEIRADATFWALHVALQNVMGWTDSHSKHPEHAAYRRWIGGRSIDPERFDPAEVRFENPAKRLREVYDLA